MKARPILFSAPMIRALLEGRKTQTRRIVKFPEWANPLAGVEFSGVDGGPAMLCRETGCFADVTCKYGRPGDRLWARETWMPDAPRDGTWPSVAFFGCKGASFDLIPKRYRKPEHCIYRATWTGTDLTGWTPSIHMKRWASRITLPVIDVRAERLQDISEADAIAEGCIPTLIKVDCGEQSGVAGGGAITARESYEALWGSINGRDSWDANPWVWVVSFEVINQNIDEVLKAAA